jgi:hypothetical protein
MPLVLSRRKILWDKDNMVAEVPCQAPSPTQAPPQIHIDAGNGTTIVVEPKVPRTYKKRTGNGHTKAKIRDLTDPERDCMRNHLFLPKNGQIDNDDCVTFRHNALPSEVAIFQVTGYISVLHTEVAEGRTAVQDLVAYEQWMREKYNGTLWARYINPNFSLVRVQNATQIANGHAPTHKVPFTSGSTAYTGAKSVPIPDSMKPKFTAFPTRRHHWGG